MNRYGNTFIYVAFAIIVIARLAYNYTVTGRAVWNNQMHAVQKADDATRYETRKQVEDTCRAMQASYAADVVQFQMYSESEDAERRSWAEQARMRANRTVATYNEYVLKNTFVWQGNVPADIAGALGFITAAVSP